MILNEPLPKDLREQIEADARLRDLTLNDTCVRVLAEYFGVAWEPRSRYRKTQSERFKLRVPEDLHRAIRLEAAQRLLTARGVALSILSEHYETERISPERRPRPRKEAAA